MATTNARITLNNLDTIEQNAIEQAQSEMTAGAGNAFGRTCYLNEAMPVIVHIVGHSRSFTEAIRANIQCGGDSCGRAWIIGPAMAAVHGVDGECGTPLSWLARVADAPAILADIELLVH